LNLKNEAIKPVFFPLEIDYSTAGTLTAGAAPPVPFTLGFSNLNY
jgi:hypothetical protein